MKLAIVSVTNNGAALANKLAQQLVDSSTSIDVFAKQGRNSFGNIEFMSLKSLIAEKFSSYDGIIFIMAVGIVVRVIAPLICDKRTDPAVVVMDDMGKHVISLLSGHIGGANELTAIIASAVGAVPVITTATDVSHKPAADMLAVKLDLAIEPFSMLKFINGAIVNGDKVAFLLDKSLPDSAKYYSAASKMGIELKGLEDINGNDAVVIISDKILSLNIPHLYLRPKTLVIGVGCRRDTPKQQILAAIIDACTKIERSVSSIKAIASSVVKNDEAGLLAVLKELSVPGRFYENNDIEDCIIKNKLKVSSFVKERIGVGNVCEAAAILAGQRSKVLLSKTRYKNVTIAIVEDKSQ